MLAELGPTDRLANALTYNFWTTSGEPNGWTREDQAAHFERFADLEGLSGTSFTDASCIDLGCGTGDFLPFWKMMRGGKYTGIDIFPSSIETAKATRESGEFRVVDFLSFTPGESFDFGFASGPFNLKLPECNNYEFLQASIKKMAEITNAGMAFNFLTDDLISDNWLFYYNPARVIEMMRKAIPDHTFVIQTDFFPEHEVVNATALVWRK